MAFFTKYNGTTDARQLRLERLLWALVYGGLLTLVLAWFAENTQGADASSLYAGGGLALAAGVLLCFVRARQPDA